MLCPNAVSLLPLHILYFSNCTWQFKPNTSYNCRTTKTAAGATSARAVALPWIRCTCNGRVILISYWILGLTFYDLGCHISIPEAFLHSVQYKLNLQAMSGGSGLFFVKLPLVFCTVFCRWLFQQFHSFTVFNVYCCLVCCSAISKLRIYCLTKTKTLK